MKLREKGRRGARDRGEEEKKVSGKMKLAGGGDGLMEGSVEGKRGWRDYRKGGKFRREGKEGWNYA